MITTDKMVDHYAEIYLSQSSKFKNKYTFNEFFERMLEARRRTSLHQ